MPSAEKPRRAYLSGGMEYAGDEGRGWREQMQEWLETALSCSVFNPNRESERLFATDFAGVDFRKLKSDDLAAYSAIATRLVEIDCGEIANNSDFVICYWDASAMRGAGTKGELTMAKYFGKPVFLVTSISHYDIPGWVLGCTTRIFSGFEELKDFLRTL